jgi:hypothetical protein
MLLYTENESTASEKARILGICPIYQDFDIAIHQAEQTQNDPFAAAGEPRQMSKYTN